MKGDESKVVELTYSPPRDEEIQRDLERAEEYTILYPQYKFVSPRLIEISTGLIIAARFADKIRRTMFAVFGKVLPKEIILQDTSKFNQQLYKIMIEKGIGKLDVVRITFKAAYNPETKHIEFSDVKIIRYLPEEECVPKSELRKLLER